MNTTILLAALSCHGLPPDAQAYCLARQNEQPTGLKNAVEIRDGMPFSNGASWTA